MHETVYSAAQWSKAMFGQVKLRDARRTARLVMLAAALAKRPCGTLPGSLRRWADLKGAYRLLESDQISHEAVIAPHTAEVRRRCCKLGDVLLIEDTSALDFTSRESIEGIGQIGNAAGRGFNLHTTLASSIQRWDDDGTATCELVGLFDQRWWARTNPIPGGANKEKRSKRMRRPRESQRWSACLEGIDSYEHCQSRWTFMADREGDIYDVFDGCESAGVDWIIRASHDRALEKEDQLLFAAVQNAPVKARKAVQLRARPGSAARKATLEIRAMQVTLRAPYRPDQTLKPRTMNIVLAQELKPRKGAEPIRWVLLTTWPITSASDCLRVVGAYEQRWLIEEYHKCLKTGCSVEDSQLTTAQSITALVGVLALVSVRLLDAKLLARARPDDPIKGTELSPAMLAILEKEFKRPRDGWTNRTLIRSIAQFGGFLARKHDGEPGWQTIWRGWNQLMYMEAGYELAGRCG